MGDDLVNNPHDLAKEKFSQLEAQVADIIVT